MKCFEHGKPLPIHSQIGEEIAYFWDYYETLHPTVFLTMKEKRTMRWMEAIFE